MSRDPRVEEAPEEVDYPIKRDPCTPEGTANPAERATRKGRTQVGRSAVSVVDCGIGNLGSMLNMLRHLDVPTELVSKPDEIRRASRLILPGVGSFDRGMTGLAERGIVTAIREHALSGAPLLGICLGMQMLSEGSAEGLLPGLGLIAGSCDRLKPLQVTERVPHMGWSWIVPTRAHPLVDAVPHPGKFYFAHSYHMVCKDEDSVLARSEYGLGIASMVAQQNIVGAQFHPEKSHAYGMAFLQAFARWDP